MSKLDRFIFISLFFHAVIFLILIFSHYWFPNETIEFERAIRIDMIALPDKVDSIQPKPVNAESLTPEKKEPTPTVIKPSEIVVPSKPTDSTITKQSSDKSKIRPNSGINKINQLSALEKLNKTIHADEQLKAQLKNHIFKGNMLADGNSLKGLTKLEAEEYVFQVEDHIRNRWKIPQWMVGKSYRAKALVKWDSNGVVTLIQFIESSGSDAFDEVVMNTIQESVPFPAPPEKFVAMMRKQGVIFGFPE